MASVRCPYPGLRPFTIEDAARFHGRDQEVRELLGRLRDGQRELYVMGPSGSGKSSLVAAGLVSSLRCSPELAGGMFLVRTMRPGADPTAALADALEATERGDAALGWLSDLVGRLLANHPGHDRLLLFVDQLEELFTTAKSQPRAAFIAAVRALRVAARVALVFTLRADFYASLMESPLWADLDGQLSRVDIGPLRGDKLRRAIEVPARALGVYFEPVLVERLLDDVADEPGALPLLQDTLLELWHQRTRGLLRLAEYEAMSDGTRTGLTVTVARRANGALSDLSPGGRDIARRVLLRLVQFGDGATTTRRQQARAALATAGDAPDEIDTVVRHLADRRLITTSGGDDAEPSARVDLAHEVLLSAWPELDLWIRSRKQDEQRRRQLEFHVAEWVKRGRGGTGLFDAIELAEAERWIAGETARELGYSSDLPRFLVASREAIEDAERQKQLALEQQARERQAAQDERARLRRRLSRSVIAILGVFSDRRLGLWIVASRERTNAQHQLALNEQERARSLIVDGHDPIDAVLHLVQAMKLGVDSTVMRTLLVETKYGLWRTAVRHGGAVYRAVFSADGTRVVTASSDGIARVWDATTGAPLGVPLKHDGPVRSAVFSADGTRVVTASDDGTARVWDATAGAPLGMSLKHDGEVQSAVFSADGTRIVTASSDGTAQIWDATTGAPLGMSLKHDGEVQSAVFSADGTRVMTASNDGTAQVWDATTGAPLSVPFKHFYGAVWSAVFSADGTRVVTASNDGTAKVWGATTGAPLGLPLKHGGEVQSAVFSADGTRVVTASSDGIARVWDATTGTPVSVPLQHDGEVQSAVFSADGTRVVTASSDGTARVWNAITGAPIGLSLKHDGPVRSAVFSADGTRVVTASADGTARVWDATTGAPLGAPLKHDGAVRSAVFSADGTRVVTASDDGTARVWDVAQTGALSAWIEQAAKCVVPGPNAVGSSVVCPLADRKSTPTDLLARARSLIAVADTATFTHVWSLSRTDYRRASEALDGTRGLVAGANERDAGALKQAVSIRLAILDGLEGRLQEARTHFGADAPGTDALLLNALGGTAHEVLRNDDVALPLLLRAHELDPGSVDLLANLAEVYFAAGQYENFARTAGKLDTLAASPDLRLAMAVLAWAAARLTRTPDAAQQARLLRTYREIASGTRAAWSWKGTRGVLTYGHHRFEDVKPILDVLALLEEEVTDETRARLAALLLGTGQTKAEPHEP